MKILRERNGQVLVKVEDADYTDSAKFEWWFDSHKMKDGIRLEEKNNKTYIYCYVFRGDDKESWLIDEFDRRVPRILSTKIS